MAKKAYIGVYKEPYKVLEYIESTGTQYINTGYIPTGENVKVVCKARLTAPLGANTLFGGTLWASPRMYLPSIIGYNDIPLINCGQAQKGAFYDTKLDTDYVFSLESKDGTFTAMRNDTVVYQGETTGTIAKLELYLFALNYENSRANGFSSARMYYFHVYDNDVLVRDFIPCINATGEIGMYDKVNDVFYANAGTELFVAGTETGEVVGRCVARKVKKGYIGIDGFARKIKKAYIGIGGVARPCWSGGELAYYGKITSLGQKRRLLSAATAGNYALFAGGFDSNNTYANVDAYDSSFVRSAPTELSTRRHSMGSASISDYALFAGGSVNGNGGQSGVDAYDKSLVRTTPTALGLGRGELASTTVGDYALFAAGESRFVEEGTYINNVDGYDSSLTRRSASGLTHGGTGVAGASNKNYALFCGGGTNGRTVSAYNASLTKTTAPDMAVCKIYHSGNRVGDYALFAGGFENFTAPRASVEVYDSALTKTFAANISSARFKMGATNNGEFALFAGGFNNSSLFSTVDVYDGSLTKTTTSNLSAARNGAAATCCNNNMFFGGGAGTDGFELYSNVDVYTIV
jgi:hypothetical protein